MAAASEFDRLPMELIISIFDKLLDVRSLCSCYSVSKQFAALVPQTRSITLRIRSASFAQSSRDVVLPHGILNFLKKLSCFERATIQSSPNPSSSDSESNLFRWKSDSSGFIFVSADKETTGCGFPLYEQDSALFSRTEHQLFDSMSGVLHMEALVDVFPNLKDVSAVDSTGRGRVVLDEGGVCKMRKEKEGKTFFSVKRWSTACLPLSRGRVMKEVTVLTVREIKHRYALVEENPFEEREYCEAAKTMMKDYLWSEVLVLAPIRVPFARVAWDALLYERNQRISGNSTLTGYSYRRDRLPPLTLEVLMECCEYAQSEFI